jgi:hypothetical protein
MEYEYVDDIAQEFELKPGDLSRITRTLGIETLQIAVPPSAAKVAAAVTLRDAQRLRAYCTGQSGG